MARFIYAPAHPEANHNGFIPAEIYYPWRYGHVAVSANVLRDQMDATRHMANGQYYESKSAFRAATKAAGCIEYGNENAHLMKPRQPVELDRRQRRDDISNSIWELKNGRKVRD